jgi:hypothetical protein
MLRIVAPAKGVLSERFSCCTNRFRATQGNRSRFLDEGPSRVYGTGESPLKSIQDDFSHPRYVPQQLQSLCENDHLTCSRHIVYPVAQGSSDTEDADVAFPGRLRRIWVLCLILATFAAQAAIQPPCAGAWSDGSAGTQVCTTACCRQEAPERGSACTGALCQCCSPSVSLTPTLQFAPQFLAFDFPQQFRMAPQSPGAPLLPVPIPSGFVSRAELFGAPGRGRSAPWSLLAEPSPSMGPRRWSRQLALSV